MLDLGDIVLTVSTSLTRISGGSWVTRRENSLLEGRVCSLCAPLCLRVSVVSQEPVSPQSHRDTEQHRGNLDWAIRLLLWQFVTVVYRQITPISFNRPAESKSSEP